MTDDQVIELPTFVVRASRSSPGNIKPEFTWLYAEFPGFEILSCCPKDETEEYVRRLQEQARLIDWMLPPEVRPADSLPYHLILDDRPMVASRELPLSSLGRKMATAPITDGGMQEWDSASYHQINTPAVIQNDARTEMNSSSTMLAESELRPGNGFLSMKA